MTDVMKELEELLIETRQEHQRACEVTCDEDEEWPLWYADYMIARAQMLLGESLTRSELICVLLNMSRLQPLEAPDEPWQSYYARHLAERYC